jgi:4-hydroxy-2-oxoheptanedioate aldolase
VAAANPSEAHYPLLVNRTREKLAGGGVACGSFLRHPDPGLAEVLATRGLDFVIFDGEHGALDPRACENLSRAVFLHGTTPGVRVMENRPAPILRLLDAGALICHVPMVGSAADARSAVRAVKYRPAGDRGLSASRASGYGAAGGYASYIERANRETMLVVHIETAAGAAAAAEIAAVEGVDVLLFGALDLSQDLGQPGRLDDPEVLEAGERIGAAAAAAGKVFGAVAGDAEDARAWAEKGARYLLTTVEALLSPAVSSFAEVG